MPPDDNDEIKCITDTMITLKKWSIPHLAVAGNDEVLIVKRSAAGAASKRERVDTTVAEWVKMRRRILLRLKKLKKLTAEVQEANYSANHYDEQLEAQLKRMANSVVEENKAKKAAVNRRIAEMNPT